MGYTTEGQLLNAWNEQKHVQLVRWRLNLRPETGLDQLRHKKDKMGRRIRRIFPRGKYFNVMARTYFRCNKGE